MTAVKKISFPSMGMGKIAFRGLLGTIPGVEVFMPPDVNRDIVKMGSKDAPEFVCLPMKITLGEFINMHVNHGISTFVQAVDCGPCRFGFYAPIQERIMKDMGYDIEIIPIAQEDILNFRWLETFFTLTVVKDKFMSSVDIIRSLRLFFLKAKYIEDIRKIGGLIRCRQIERNATKQTETLLFKLLDEEMDILKLHSFDKIIKREFKTIEIKRDFTPLRIKITGENHVALESYANMDIIEKFGKVGIEVHVGNTLYDWMMHKAHLSFHKKELARLSEKYIPLDIGGEAQWVIGDYIKCQNEGFDGFVHIYPFTCMPETSARAIIEGQTPDPFYLPIQYYSLDEHTGFEGMRTRMEAFIDLMDTNRENNPRFMGKYVEPLIIDEIWGEKEEKSGLQNILGDIGEFMENMVMPLVNSLNLFSKKE